MRFRQRSEAPRFWPQRPRRMSAARPLILAAILGIVWAGADPKLVESPGFLSGEPERVAAQFTRCGPGRLTPAWSTATRSSLANGGCGSSASTPRKRIMRLPGRGAARRAGDRQTSGSSERRSVRRGCAGLPPPGSVRPRSANDPANFLRRTHAIHSRGDARERPRAPLRWRIQAGLVLISSASRHPTTIAAGNPRSC